MTPSLVSGNSYRTGRCRLVIQSGPAAGTVFPLLGQPVLIGRLASNDLTLNERQVSRVHARLFVRGRRYCIEDTESRLGTWVNGRSISRPTPLEAGDEILIGSVLLYFWQDQPIEN